MERVRRMYSTFESRPSERHDPKPKSEPVTQERPKPPPKPKPNEPEASEEKGGFLDILMRDKDQSLIMLLLVLLMKDGADMNLMLALVYLLI